MLPFLQKRAAGGVTTQVRKPDTDEPDQDAPLKSCGQDLIDGVQAGDVQRVISALKAAFEILDYEPHVEGPHLESDDQE